MAPSLELPRGSASSHTLAGVSYHSFSSCAGRWNDKSKMSVVRNNCILFIPVTFRLIDYCYKAAPGQTVYMDVSICSHGYRAFFYLKRSLCCTIFHKGELSVTTDECRQVE